MNPSDTEPSADAALQRVGLCVKEIIEVLGSLISEAEVYLVGSLAAGLGNKGSDVDLHIFSTEEVANGTPSMFFIGDRIIDLQFFSPGQPSEVCSSYPNRPERVNDLAVSTGITPSVRETTRLARWLSALAFDDTARSLYSSAETQLVRALVTRRMLVDAAEAAGVAHLVSSGGSAAAAYAWQRAARAALAVLAARRGQFFYSSKWAWAKARRVSLDDSLTNAFSRVRDLAGWQAAWSIAQLPDVDPMRTTRLMLSGRAERHDIGGESFQVIGRHLVCSSTADLYPCGLPTQLDKTTRNLLARGLLDVRVDDEAFDSSIRQACGAGN